MIGLLQKHWKFIIDILIVIALCIAFSYFDPFKMFRKTELHTTANIISNIKSIGELVTAEFYGEVINHKTVDPLQEADYADMAKQFFLDCKELILEIKNDNGDFYGIRELKEDYNEYSYLLSFTASELLGIDKKKVKRKLKNGKINWIEEKVFEKVKKRTGINENKYSNYLNFKNNLLNNRNKKNDKIILIARGTVKAGFKFDKLDESNFIYKKDKKYIVFYGLHAQMLDTIINPWFIPELEIEGYEFVNVPKNTDYSKVISLKKNCKTELGKQAYDAGIVENAQKYGKEVLETFFAAILNDPEIKVEFRTLDHDSIINNITKDLIVSDNEINSINQIFNKLENVYDVNIDEEKQEINNQKRILIGKLKKCKYEPTNTIFNLYHIEYFNLLNYLEINSYNDTIKNSDNTYKIVKKTTAGDSSYSTKLYVKQYVEGIRDSLREKGRKYSLTYTNDFIEQYPFWYKDKSFISDYNDFAKMVYKNTPLDTLLLYPNIINYSDATIGNLGIYETEKIDFIIDSLYKNQLNAYCIEVVKNIEKKKAIYYVQSRPVKSFINHTKNKIFIKN